MKTASLDCNGTLPPSRRLKGITGPAQIAASFLPASGNLCRAKPVGNIKGMAPGRKAVSPVKFPPRFLFGRRKDEKTNPASAILSNPHSGHGNTHRGDFLLGKRHLGEKGVLQMPKSGGGEMKEMLKDIISFFRWKHPSEMTQGEWYDELAWWYQF